MDTDIEKIVREEIGPLIDAALREDLGENGDVTSLATLSAKTVGEASIIAKEKGTLAGLSVAEAVFKCLDADLSFKGHRCDGERLAAGVRVAGISGRVRSILAAERTALNFLQRLSGVATLTSRFVAELDGLKTKVLDTRKTTPGFRKLEKYAVRVGRGMNHRMGLYDMVLLKENHVAAANGITTAVSRAKEYSKRTSDRVQIAVEVRSLTELKEALAAEADRILLDNMTLDLLRQAVAINEETAVLEASGGITLVNVREVAETGVDYVSIGALTHSAPALDLSLILL